MSLIDVHAHLDMLETSPAETYQLALNKNVSTIITIGTEPADHPIVLDIAKSLYPKVYCTLGVHPHQANLWSTQVREFIKDHAMLPYVVAVGEIGLDYYYNTCDPIEQKKAFHEQLELSIELDLPVQIHTREAEEDTISILEQFRGKAKGIIHCFTGSQQLAEACLDLGFYISISGVVTFKNAENLRSIVKSLPVDRFTVETDSPFLAPAPHRGKKNTPAYVADIAKFVAELRGLDYQQLVQLSRDNTIRVFNKIHS
jgi:TatD DNase family protein